MYGLYSRAAYDGARTVDKLDRLRLLQPYYENYSYSKAAAKRYDV